jgi:C_GCAxxG_C_C family probable redox protein
MKAADVPALAAEIHAQGYHCSETVLRAVGAYVLGEDSLDEMVLRMSSTMHGGLANTETGRCGALLAGIMLIGALYGRYRIDQDSERANAIAKRYWGIFMEEFGTDHCGTLKTGEPGPEYPSVCGTVMVRAAGMLAALIEEESQASRSEE